MATEAASVEERERHREGREGVGAGRAFAWLLVITGAAGLPASWVITMLWTG
ncbi:hypothetical protein OG803_12650 [Streptomyces sp. NBC_00467]